MSLVTSVTLVVEACDLDYNFDPDLCFATDTTIAITIDDFNEFPPRCIPTQYTKRWSEDPTTTPSATNVVDFNTYCVDPDSTGAALSYNFVTAPSGEFVLTGSILETDDTLDFETTPSYFMTVEVSDGLLTSTVTVTVEVLDANDNTPTAGSPSLSPASPSISENVNISTYVATVSYTDADSNNGFG